VGGNGEEKLMKIRDLWQRVGESRSGPRRGSVLTNRPEVNVLDRLPNRLSVKAEIPLRPASNEKKTFTPLAISVVLRIESLCAFCFDSRSFRRGYSCFLFEKLLNAACFIPFFNIN